MTNTTDDARHLDIGRSAPVDDVGTPTVSVILSTHNRAESLTAAIESVLAQTYPALQLLVIDDASTDDTAKILANYAEDSRVATLRNDTNLGLPASLNRGIDASEGDFIARIDDDDYWTDDHKLARQVDFMQKNPACGVLGTAYIDEWGREITNPVDDEAIRRQMLFRCPFCHPTVLIRRTAIDQCGGYDERLPYAEDWDIWLRIGQHWMLANLREVCLTKRQGRDSLSELNFKPQLRLAHEFSRRYSNAYPRALTARCYHRLSLIFFGLVPPGGRVHKLMQRVFLRTFGLGSDN
jgi:glycosyltransferase involved in cell wall biosynthesis